MAKYISNRQQNLKIGIVSYTEDKTVLEVTGNVGIGTTNATSELWVDGDGYFTGIVTANSFRGDGSQLTGVTGTQIVTQDSISTPVFLTFANNIGVTSLGVATTGSNVLSVIPSSGNLGIGTTNPTMKLWVNGSGNFIGSVTSSDGFYVNGSLIGGSISGTDLVGTALSISGISTFTNGPVLIGGGTSTGTASQKLQVTGGAYVSSNVGVAVTAPSFAVDVSGDARVQSTGKMRFGGTAGSTNFYIQFNSTTNSLDFVAG